MQGHVESGGPWLYGGQAGFCGFGARGDDVGELGVVGANADEDDVCFGAYGVDLEGRVVATIGRVFVLGLWTPVGKDVFCTGHLFKRDHIGGCGAGTRRRHQRYAVESVGHIQSTGNQIWVGRAGAPALVHAGAIRTREER